MNEEENIENYDDLNEEQILNYLKGNLSEKENHDVEKNMMDSDFVNDAVEGLQSLSNNNKLDDYVNLLNKKLHEQLSSKKRRKEKRKIKGLEWILLAAVIVLVVCVTAYVVIIMLKK
jgi:hypothetical protein